MERTEERERTKECEKVRGERSEKARGERARKRVYLE